MTTFWGVDPGKTGALALIAGDFAHVIDWPGSEALVADEVRWLVDCFGAPALCVVEQQQAMPGDAGHASSMAKLMINFGGWLGVLSALQIPIRTVLPRRWKAAYLPARAPKSASVTIASRLYPKAALRGPRGGALDGRADALLLADFARKLHESGK